MDSLGDFSDPLRAVVNSIHSRHDGKKHLSRTDVACRFIAPNMLLASLQCEANSRTTFRIFGYPHNSTRDLSLILIFGRKKRCMGSAKSHRDSKPLTTPHNDVRTELTWGL